MKRQLSKYVPFKLAILLMTFMVSMSSCEDYLNQKPTDGLVFNDYWKNKEQVLSTLGGAYQYLGVMDYDLFVHGELRGDLLQPGVNTPSAERAIMSANIQQNQAYAKWDKFYKVINVCNHIIDLAPAVQNIDKTFTDYQLQQYISEATFLRSLCYFYLVRIFQDVPYVTVPSSTDEGEFFPEVTLGTEILANIKADLESVRLLMPSHPTDEMQKSRASTAACNALLADISLWNFEYDDCIKYITAIENITDPVYFLPPALEWYDNYYKGATVENIFEIYYNQAAGQGNSINEKTYEPKNRSDIKYFISEYAYEILNDDVALAGEMIRSKGTMSNSFQVWKYAGRAFDGQSLRSTGEKTSANFIIYRLADIYLMKAEALSQSETPNYSEALRYINMVRERALMTPYPSLGANAAAYEEAILLERAKELAYEGKRWFDLLRMGRRPGGAGKDKLIDILIQNVPSTQQLVMKSRLRDENGWYMPIHSDEIKRNKNLKQNSYYDETK